MIWSVRQNASASLLYITSTATVAMAVEQKIYPPYEAVAWENSWNFEMPPRVYPRIDVWGTSAEIPY